MTLFTNKKCDQYTLSMLSNSFLDLIVQKLEMKWDEAAEEQRLLDREEAVGRKVDEFC